MCNVRSQSITSLLIVLLSSTRKEMQLLSLPSSFFCVWKLEEDWIVLSIQCQILWKKPWKKEPLAISNDFLLYFLQVIALFLRLNPNVTSDIQLECRLFWMKFMPSFFNKTKKWEHIVHFIVCTFIVPKFFSHLKN